MPHDASQIVLKPVKLRADGTAKCPDCGRRMKHKRSDEGKGVRDFLECVYCHGKMRCNSLGQPIVLEANRETRYWRVQAHKAFDVVYQNPWDLPELKDKFRTVRRNKRRHHLRLISTMRRNAYHWLADMLGMDRYECHIGNMNKAQCKNVIAVCEGVTAAHIFTWAQIEKGRL